MKTKDWVGLVDIVLRGEAALLGNRKSGDPQTLSHSSHLSNLSHLSHFITPIHDIMVTW